MNPTSAKHLALFLGPKAENSGLLENMITLILRDYFHWRKNYFPSDPILITQTMQREFIDEQDRLSQAVQELMALLRRNFPFYSPRYFAHQLSDTLLASTAGYIAGMLFNPNNVTPEAAPVTTELEIEACSELLRMLGFTPPPELPIDVTQASDIEKYYQKHAERGYGWAHITSGGTIANIEALWVSRQVRYFPLAVQEVAKDLDLDIEVQLPSSSVKAPPKTKGQMSDIRTLSQYQLLVLRPNESLYLLPKFLRALTKLDKYANTPRTKLGQLGWDILAKSRYALSNGTGAAFSLHSPQVFVAGTRHYSVTKAAELVGIGRRNVIPVAFDSQFRLDILDLERKLRATIRMKKVPLCVVASVGTTEEGAVDPVHELVDLRTRLELETNTSFWLHIDAAWGGYLRSLFCIDARDRAEALALKVGSLLGILFRGDLLEWQKQLKARVLEVVNTDGLTRHVIDQKDVTNAAEVVPAVSSDGVPSNGDVEQSPTRIDHDLLEGPGSESDRSGGKDEPPNLDKELRERERKHATERRFMEGLEAELDRIASVLSSGDYENYIRLLQRLPERFADRQTTPRISNFDFGLFDINDWIRNYVSDFIEIGDGKSVPKRIQLSWPSPQVGAAFVAFPHAESITVDPHKMGYGHYPLGCIAFKNDLTRLFILEQAPYISRTIQDPLLQLPPRHSNLDMSGHNRKTVVQSFSRFILEGSRPGASAASLWLSIKTVPLSARHHGAIVRESLLAARALYEWLLRWNLLFSEQEHGIDFQFVPLTADKPDTNLVTFVIRKKNSHSLKDLNELTRRVYRTFSIQSELGERQHSYSQPFFLSSTEFCNSEYPGSLLSAVFDSL